MFPAGNVSESASVSEALLIFYISFQKRLRGTMAPHGIVSGPAFSAQTQAFGGG